MPTSQGKYSGTYVLKALTKTFAFLTLEDYRKDLASKAGPSHI